MAKFLYSSDRREIHPADSQICSVYRHGRGLESVSRRIKKVLAEEADGVGIVTNERL